MIWMALREFLVRGSHASWCGRPGALMCREPDYIYQGRQYDEEAPSPAGTHLTSKHQCARFTSMYVWWLSGPSVKVAKGTCWGTQGGALAAEGTLTPLPALDCAQFRCRLRFVVLSGGTLHL